MAIISIASLKGGVGKTSIAVNVARGCARRNARVLLVDLDPAGHAANLLLKAHSAAGQSTSPLGHFLQHPKLRTAIEQCGSVLGAAERLGLSLTSNVDLSLDVLEGGAALENALRSGGQKMLKGLLGHLLSELDGEYDYIFIDTEPSYSALTEAALEAATVAVVPVDASVMSVWGLEQLLERTQGLGHLTWCIVRNMISRQSSKLRAVAQARLETSVSVQAGVPDADRTLEQEHVDGNFDEFMGLVSEYEKGKPANAMGSGQGALYLLDSIIFRSDILNRLSHEAVSVFDSRLSSALADQYMNLSREIERVVALAEREDISLEADDSLGMLGFKAA